MKTLEGLMKEVMANEELKQAFMEAFLNGTAAEFVSAQGIVATKEEIRAALGEVTEQPSRELSDADMANVTGAGPRFYNGRPCPKCGGTDTTIRPTLVGRFMLCNNCNKLFE